MTKNIESFFTEHEATVKSLDKDTQVLTWKDPGTRDYEIDYVFYKNMIFITGDLCDAVVNCTWEPRWDYDWEHTQLAYFAEKMTACKDGIYIWSSKDAIEDLKNAYRDLFEELNDREYKELTEYVSNELSLYYIAIDGDVLEDVPHSDKIGHGYLLQYCLAIKYAGESSSTEEFIYGIQNESCFEDFYNFWERGYNCGKRFNPKIEYYLVGLRMAYKQLKAKEKTAKEEHTQKYCEMEKNHEYGWCQFDE